MAERFSTGIERLDKALGGGLLPGSLTMVIGATGVGKTQFGIHLAAAGGPKENRAGNGSDNAAAFIDLSSRGDSQNHEAYAHRLLQRQLRFVDLAKDSPGMPSEKPADIISFLGYGGRRVMRSQLDVDQWHAWQSDMNRRLPQLYRFIYGHLIHGTRRFIVDGIEPLDDSSDSLQLDLLELIYHQMLRKDYDWLAREVLRENFRANAEQVAKLAYPSGQSACAVLVTTKQSMLEQLITQPMSDGDLAATANTVIFVGRTMQDGRLGRALYIAKHRGSYAESEILPFEIDDTGIVMPG